MKTVKVYRCPKCGEDIYETQGECVGCGEPERPELLKVFEIADIVSEQIESKSIRPRIVCLCGSTRFGDAFREANLRETLAGRIVLTVGCDFKSDQGLGLTDEDKARLDELHKRKIDLADEVLVLNVNGYIGSSTRSEIDYATNLGKPIRYLEPLARLRAGRMETP